MNEDKTKMATVQQAMDFAFDNNVTVGVDVQEWKGCVKTILTFKVFFGKRHIVVKQEQKGSRRWKVSGKTYESRGAAMIAAICSLTGAIYSK